MKIERLRKSHKKEIVIGGLITICIISAIAFVGTRAKYKTTERLEHVITGTIKYTPYDFKIMAMYKSEDGTNYTEIENRMPSSGYVINEEKSYCTIDNKTHDTEAKLYTNNNGEHVIKNLTKSDKCYLYFDKLLTSKDTLEKLNITDYKTTAPDFSQVATTDEGIFMAEDPMYVATENPNPKTYYFRGAVENNYLTFAGFCWRIIRINGDGTIRLIYDGTTCHANGTSTTDSLIAQQQTYNLNYDRSEYAGYTYTEGSQRPTDNLTGTSSNLKTQTDTWYNNNIENNTTYSEKIANGKYCNDRNVEAGYSWSSQSSDLFYYAGYNRIYSAKPTLECNFMDVYTLKIGAITADEVIIAGAKWATKNNRNYYLYNGKTYWTMTPYCAPGASAMTVNGDGSAGGTGVQAIGGGIRPVINLKANTQFQVGGNGTLDNPYVVVD